MTPLTKIAGIKIHSLAGIVPMANNIEQLSLQEDIRINGQNVPIILYKNEIIDGRCRALACENLGIKPISEKLSSSLSEKEVAKKVLSLNIRRNLTKTQKAASAYYQWKTDTSLKKNMLYTAWGVDAKLFAAAESLDTLQGTWLKLLFEGNKLPIGVPQKDTRGVLRQKQSASLIAVNNWAVIVDHTLERVIESQKDEIVEDFINDLNKEHPQIRQEYYTQIRTLNCSDNKVVNNKKTITVDEKALNRLLLESAKRAFKP